MTFFAKFSNISPEIKKPITICTYFSATFFKHSIGIQALHRENYVYELRFYALTSSFTELISKIEMKSPCSTRNSPKKKLSTSVKIRFLRLYFPFTACYLVTRE